MIDTKLRLPRRFAGLTFLVFLLGLTPWLFLPGVSAQAGPPGHWGGRAGFGGPRHGGKVVTGAPYIAQAVTTTTDTLANGSHINRQITATIARDSQGRTMRSQTFNGFAGNTQNGATIVTIFDPVAQERIEYNSRSKTARIFPLPTPSSENSKPPRHGRTNNSQANVVTSSLGTETISGVSAQGTQTVRTIPAGTVGNDTALEITEQEWYSPDLQMVVQSTRTDPRFGQTTYTLNNIQRIEPEASLFQVPAGYQTKTITPPSGSGGE